MGDQFWSRTGRATIFWCFWEKHWGIPGKKLDGRQKYRPSFYTGGGGVWFWTYNLKNALKTMHKNTWFWKYDLKCFHRSMVNPSGDTANSTTNNSNVHWWCTRWRIVGCPNIAQFVSKSEKTLRYDNETEFHLAWTSKGTRGQNIWTFSEILLLFLFGKFWKKNSGKFLVNFTSYANFDRELGSFR